MSRDLDLPSSLRLRVGEAWEARLPGLGSAGYGWQVDVGDSSVVDVELRSLPPDDDTPPGGPPPDTYNVDQVLTLRAVQRGRTAVRLQQTQPWEVDQPPLRAHDIALVVE